MNVISTISQYNLKNMSMLDEPIGFSTSYLMFLFYFETSTFLVTNYCMGWHFSQKLVFVNEKSTVVS